LEASFLSPRQGVGKKEAAALHKQKNAPSEPLQWLWWRMDGNGRTPRPDSAEPRKIILECLKSANFQSFGRALECLKISTFEKSEKIAIISTPTRRFFRSSFDMITCI
jgi:hypothetical protein